MKIKIGNIQRFSLHDGPGIRTTVFLKGCTIHCPWCSNPENISYQTQWAFDKERCIKIGDDCILDSKCPMLNKKDIIGKVIEINDYKICSAKALYFQGTDMPLEDIEEEVLKDLSYYQDGGGVTFSGGEPLSHLCKYENLLVNLKKQHINIAVETAMFINETQLEMALKYVDLFIVDIKILQENFCKDILGGNGEVYRKNIKRLFEENKHVWFRMPIIKAYTYNKENIKLVLNLLKEYKPDKMEIFEVHRLAKKKYEMLNKLMLEFEDITILEIEKLKKDIVTLGINVEIIDF